jgi:hypothetical protein
MQGGCEKKPKKKDRKKTEQIPKLQSNKQINNTRSFGRQKGGKARAITESFVPT